MDLEFLKEHSDYIYKKYPPNLDKNQTELILRVVKLQEEVGELAEAVLDYVNQQRDKEKKIDIMEEIADVLITTIMIAYWLDIDPIEILNKKIEVLRKRTKD